ncbi:GTP cyclohydrolase II [Roseospirillum parvum]|uniref:GTP cyclohydrolase-2 n=1 Tax=Roseospirillum parvum TaxID=83401 RepID=A0A1G8FX27_9PROT|nr:GTP cyclohydrolase II [Roseospirillum parvum]SDH86708.1 GTP cyclohydrolase II [Roseospirillum parvum]
MSRSHTSPSPFGRHAAPDARTVNRVVGDIRHGLPVVVTPASPEQAALVVLAAEGITPQALDALGRLAGAAPRLLVTGRRAMVMGLIPPSSAPDHNSPLALLAGPEAPLDAAAIARLAAPGSEADRPGAQPDAFPWRTADKPVERAAVQVMKAARLLPAAVVAEVPSAAPAEWAAANSLLSVGADQALDYEPALARGLRQVGAARVPLKGAEETRVLAFRPADGGIEHIALVIGQPGADGQPVLTRLHSECFTGDLLGSLRCDCGDQLRGAIEAIAEAGSGVLLYLAQEGRGIGLVNKLRAYELQDMGYDTLDANEQLGFDDDERIYLPAAEILARLGISRVRLMTNNPAKLRALARHGVEVTERVPHVFEASCHARSYLHTKATRSGHLF